MMFKTYAWIVVLFFSFWGTGCSSTSSGTESESTDCYTGGEQCPEGSTCTMNASSNWVCLPDGVDAGLSPDGTPADFDSGLLDGALPILDMRMPGLDMNQASADLGLMDAAPVDAQLSDAGTMDMSSDGGSGLVPEPAECERGFESLEVVRDIAYADVDPRHRLDLYPVRSERPTPVLIWIHGGGWRAGSKDRVSPVFLDFRERGYTVVSVEYRLSDAAWPATVSDVKAAVRFLRANAEQYNLDAERFVAIGSSAGGHLVSMLGTSTGANLFRDEALGHVNVSDAVQAVVNFYGPSDLDTMDLDAMEHGCPAGGLCHDCEDSPESMLLDCRPSQCTARADQASPVNYVDGDEPPFLTIHGAADCTVPTPQGRRLHRALEAVGVESTLLEVPDAGHNVSQCLANGNTQVMTAFVERVIRGCADPEVVIPDDARLNACHWMNCTDQAAQCEASPVCVALEECFQDCFQRELGGCIRRCLDSVPDAQTAVDVHRPLFECGREQGCYPRP